MPKRPEDYKEARREEIVIAALEVALEKGLAHTTLRDIAAHGEVSMGAITNYFARREEIVQRVADLGQSQRWDDLAGAADDEAPLEALGRAFAKAANREAFLDVAALELDLVTEGRVDGEVGETVRAGAEASLEELTALLRQAGVRARDAQNRARMLLVAYYGLAATSLLGVQPSKAAIRRLVKAFVEGDAP
ncbi:MAG: TetR/AcrR family transcriptional regulator [Sandaracinaceae bacterium]